MKIKFIIILTLSSLNFINSYVISCHDEIYKETHFGNLSDCWAKNVISLESSPAGITNARYSESITISDSPLCIEFPSHIGFRFPSLKALTFSHTGLKKITQENLKPLEMLRGLYIEHSKLTSLDGYLFKYSKNLEVLSMKSNLIVYVEPKIFTPLKKLTSLNFDHNTCIHESADGIDNVKKLTHQIERSCKEKMENSDVLNITDERNENYGT